MEKEFKTFKEFYPFYIGEHQLPITKLFHFFGSLFVLLALIAGVLYSPWFFLVAPVVGYGPAWVSHFFIEKNRPATFKYPLYSLMGDWVMFWEILKGKHKVF